MTLFIVCFLILSRISCSYCWDNDDLEIFDLVEEVNTNFYTLLGIPQNANASAVRKAFRTLSLQLHPDKNSAPDAEEKFRQLVSVYDVLKEQTKREKYDEVLKNGLPNWKSAVYYYRHARKVGLIELGCILFVLISIGQYIIGWASYVEQKFNFESIKKIKEKKLRKAAKGKNTIEVQQAWIDDIPKPSVLDTLPIQIPKLLWSLIINFPATVSCIIKMISEAIEQRKLQKEAELAEMEEEYQAELKEEKPKRRKKVPFVPQEREFEEKSCLLDPADASPIVEKYRPAPIAGGFWSDDDLAELARLANKYPPGTLERWERIADIMNRSVPEVTHMALKIKDNPHLFLKTSEEPSTVLEDSPKKVKTKAESTSTEVDPNSNASWSQLQQKAFENALQKFPKGSVSDRWEKISKSVPNKTKEECIQRYKYLVDLLKKQKNKGGSENVEETTEQ